MGCSPTIFKSKWTKEVAPATYLVRFETTKGDFDIKVKREWSPKAADRFHQLVSYNYFDASIFYRVLPKFVAQFGSSDLRKQRAWKSYKILDENVLLENTKGTLSFARSTKETRGTDLYINLENNSRLDTLNYNDVVGFPAFGKVIKGMDVVLQIYSGYEAASAKKLNLMYSDRVKYLEEFPKLDLIQKVYFLKE